MSFNNDGKWCLDECSALSILVKKIFLRPKRKICLYHNEFHPSRKTILFIHDVCGYARQWSGQWRHFKQQYNIVAFDMYGHGVSEASRDESAYYFQQTLFDAQAVLEQYCSDHTVLFCHGFSSDIGFALAALYPSIKKIILINPLRFHDRSSQWYYRLPLWYLQLSTFINNRLLTSKARKAQLSDLPKPHVLKYSILNCHKVPDIPYDQIQQQVMLIQSKYHSLSDQSALREFYFEQISDVSNRTLHDDSHDLMVEQKDKINYHADLFLEKLDVTGFRNIVFEGAGVRGIAYAGAILALEAMGVLKNIKNVAGASAGSFYALFLALGCTGEEVYEEITKLNYSMFISNSGNFITNSTRFLTDFGWYKTDAIYNWASNFIDKRTGKPDLTFRQLRKLGKRDLYLTGTNLSKSCAEIFSCDNTPDMEIRDAIRISCSIPMYFKAYKMKSEEGEQVMVDGGLSCNYPIDLFDYETYVDNPHNAHYIDYNRSDNTCFNHETLGFRLDPLYDPIHEYYKPQPYKKISNILDYGKAFVQFLQSIYVKRHLHQNDWNRTVFINTHDIGSTDFTISQENVDRLIEEGKIGVKKHFAWRMSNDGLRFPQ